MQRPDARIAERQREALATLASLWSKDLDHDTSDGIRAAVSAFRERVEDLDPADCGELLEEILVDALRKAYAIDHPGQRYAAYQDSHRDTESSDDLTYFKVESDLERALGLFIEQAGTPGFDHVLGAWEKLDVTKVYNHGMDFGLRKTLSLMVPIADARLALVTGDLEVEDILAAYPEGPGNEAGFAA